MPAIVFIGTISAQLLRETRRRRNNEGCTKGRHHVPESGARALVDAGVFLIGTMHESHSALAANQKAGADEIVLNLGVVGAHRSTQVALRGSELLRTSLEALTPRHCLR